MDCLTNLSGCELVGLAGIIAISLSQNLSADETDILGNFFSALGSNLSTIAIAQATKEDCNLNTSDPFIDTNKKTQ